MAARHFVRLALLLTAVALTVLFQAEPSRRAEALPAISLDLLPGTTSTSFPNVVAITHAGDGSGRLFITQQTGVVRVYDPTQVPPLLATPFLDLTGDVSTGYEQGLLSIAFHPDYPSPGYVYANYTNTSGNTVIARFTISGNPNVLDEPSETLILPVVQPFENHNGGQLQFGPDGYLYIGMGDGGSGDDPDERAQDINDLLGKMLRIDVDGGSPYASPPDNPYVGTAGLDQIWAIGLRNPWRFSFDRLTGDMFIADVGQGALEEVSFQPEASAGGENYGWDVMEGSVCHEPSSGCNMSGKVLPIIEYANDATVCAVVGGYRYRGTAIAGLYGEYLYADHCGGQIWAATAGTPWTSSLLIDTAFFISAFGEDESGELYIARHSGTNPPPGSQIGGVYRITSADGDEDGVPDISDNCPGAANPLQENNDAAPAWPWIADGIGAEGSTTGGDACDVNDDNAGCGDTIEPTLAPARAPLDPWDFADMWVPALPAAGGRNGAIGISDALAVISWTGTTNGGGPNVSGRDYDNDANGNGVEDGAEYDRAPTGTVGLSGPPSGAVSISDVLVVIAQSGDAC